MKAFLGKIRLYVRIFGLKGLVVYCVAPFKPDLVFKTKARKIAPSVYMRAGGSDLWTYKQIFIDEEYSFEGGLCPESVIIDGGANIGLTSVYLDSKYDCKKIIALEIDVDNFQLLKKNTEGRPSVVPVFAAVWGKNQKLKMVDPGGGAWGYQAAQASPEEANIEGLSINEIIERFSLEQVDLLKLDIEGGELEVFDSEPKQWLEKIGIFAIELHEQIVPGVSDLFHGVMAGVGETYTKGELTFCVSHSYTRKKEYE